MLNPDQSIPLPEDLNPLTDVLYLEKGVIKKLIPKHSRVKPKELLMAAEACIHILGEVMYGEQKDRFKRFKHLPTWADCLLSEIANEFSITTELLVALLAAYHNMDHCIFYLCTDGFRTWAVKAGLDQIRPFVDEGLKDIAAYYESKGAADSLPGEDLPPRSFGNG